MPTIDNEPATKSIGELIKSLSENDKKSVNSMYALDKKVSRLIAEFQVDVNTEIAVKALMGDQKADHYIQVNKIEIFMQLLCVSISHIVDFNKRGALVTTSRLFNEMFNDILKITMENGQRMSNEEGKNHDNSMD